MEGHTFVDLYAGAGTVGLEAVSRGAKICIFVEQERHAVGALRDNIRLLGCGERCEVLERPVGLIGEEVYGRASIIFLDPPYGPEPGLPNLRAFLEAAARPPLVIYQWDRTLRPPRAPRVPPGWIPDRMGLLDERRYGRTVFSLYYEEGA